jgi:hypothetical protein
MSRGALAVASSFVVVGLILGASSSGCSSHQGEEEDLGHTSQALEAGTASRRLVATGDTYVREGAPHQNQGASPTLRLQASASNRILVRFDPAAVATLTDAPALLKLTIASNGNSWGATGRAISVHRLTRDWTELGATFTCSCDTNTSNASRDC